MTARRGLAVVLATAGALCLGAAAPALSQEGADSVPSLAAAREAADRGRLDEARRLLAAWREARADAAGGEESARALELEARLAVDADSARRLYARLAVEGGADVAPRARLRLAQLRMAQGRPDRALEDLRLLRADFPGGPLDGESWLWTGHARRLAGDGPGACEAYRRAAGAATGADVRSRAEAALSDCGVEGGADVRSWAVQLGAFRDSAAAASLGAKARDAGFPSRVLPPDDEGLRRVRAGRWGTRSDAEAAARRLEEMGFRVLVVEARATEEDGDGR